MKINTRAYVGIRRNKQCSAIQRRKPDHGVRFNGQLKCENGEEATQRTSVVPPNCVEIDVHLKELVKTVVKRLSSTDLTFSDWIQSTIQPPTSNSYQPTHQRIMKAHAKASEGVTKDTGPRDKKNSDVAAVTGVKSSVLGAWGGSSGASLFKEVNDKVKKTPPVNPYSRSKAWGSMKPDGKGLVTQSTSKKQVTNKSAEKAWKSPSRQHSHKKSKSNDGTGSGKKAVDSGNKAVVKGAEVAAKIAKDASLKTPSRTATNNGHGVSTPIKVGSKRTADKSPQVTPNYKVKPQDDPTFPTRDLQAKLNSVAGESKLTEKVAKAIVDDEDYTGQLWWKEEAFTVMSGELKSKEGAIYPEVSSLDYIFGEDLDTRTILPTVNFFVLAEKLQKECVDYDGGRKFPPAHPVNGPFRLTENKAKQTIQVRDMDDVVVLEVQRFDVEHYLLDYAFAMEDKLTYFTMCWKAREIIDAMTELYLFGEGQWRALGDSARGSFKIVEGGKEGKRYLQNRTGDVICIEPVLCGEWDAVKYKYGVEDSKTAKVRTFRNSTTGNKYESLSEAEDDEEEADGSTEEDLSSVSSGNSSGSEESTSSSSSGSSLSSTGTGSKDVDSEEEENTSSSDQSAGLLGKKQGKSAKGKKKGAKKPKAATRKSKRAVARTSYSELSDEDSAGGMGASGKASTQGKKPTRERLHSNSKAKGAKSAAKKSAPQEEVSSPAPLEEMKVSIRAEAEDGVEAGEQSDEDYDGTDLNDTLIQDISPKTPSFPGAGDAQAFSPGSTSSLSGVLDPKDGVVMLSCNMAVVAGVDNADRVVEGTKKVLETMQIVDKTARIVGRLDALGTGLPHIKSPDDPNFFTSNTISMSGYTQVNNPYALKQKELSDKEIKAQLKRDQVDVSKLSAKKQKKHAKKTAGRRYVLNIYTTVAIKTAIKNYMWERVIESVDLELSRSSNISVSIKPMQCWDSASKKVLIGVQNNFCPMGIGATLEHYCREVEKKYLATSGKPLDYFDKDLPPLNVTLRKLRELELPDEERNLLTFDSFPDYTQYVFHIETSEEGWARYEALLDILARSGKLQKLFGDKAHLMTMARGRKANIGFTRKFQGKGRISMAYQAASTVIECGSVASYDQEVKVRMAERPVLDSQGTPTGETYIPKRPYSRTTLRKELSNIVVDGVKVFQACVMTMAPPEQGQSKIAVPYDPTCEAYKRIFSWASATVATLPSFCYCVFKHVSGYNDATIKRLLNSFYLNHQVTAHECTWHPDTFSVSTTHSTYADTYLEDNADMDPQSVGKEGAAVSFANATARAEILERLNYKPEQTCEDIRSGASAVTGEDGTSAASSIRSETSMGAALGRSTSVKMDLARARRALAEKDVEFRKMQMQLEELMEARGMDIDEDVVGPPELKKNSTRVAFQEASSDETMTEAAGTVENMERGSTAGSQAPC